MVKYLPSVRVIIFILTVAISYGLIEKHFPIVVGGNLTVGHLYLAIQIVILVTYRKSRFIKWLTR